MKNIIVFILVLLCSVAFGLENVAATLDEKVKAVAPIHGVSLSKVNDKTTWRIDFKDEATPEQRAAAQQIMQDFDPATAKPAPAPEGSTNWSIVALWLAVGVLALKVGIDPKILRANAEAQASVDSKQV